MLICFMGFRGCSYCKESNCNAGDLGSVPRLGRSPGEGNGYPLQYSGLENSTNRAWWATVHGSNSCKESDMTEWLSVSLFSMFYMVLEKTVECPLDSKEIKPVNLKGNQSWILIGRTNAEAWLLWPPDAKSCIIGKDLDGGKDWGQKEKRVTEDEMVGWHHCFNGHEFGQTLEDSEGQRDLVCCSPWSHKESDMTEQLNWTDIYTCVFLFCLICLYFVFYSFLAASCLFPWNILSGRQRNTFCLNECYIKIAVIITSFFGTSFHPFYANSV